MKKLFAILLAAIFCLNLAAIPAFAANDTIRARALPSAATDSFQGFKVTELTESCTVKKSAVTVADGEMLLIRKGAALQLYQGARIDGAVYVENGARLVLSGGTLTVSGGASVVSDGILSVGSKGIVSVLGGGEVFVGKKGRLKISKEDSLQFDPLANVICLGKNNSKNAKIGKKVLAAYVSAEDKVTAAEKPDTLLPSGTDYCADFMYRISKNVSAVSFVFDSGASLRVLRNGENFAVIGSCSTAVVGAYTKQGGSGVSYNGIYEIEGKDYVLDLETGGMTVLLEKDGTFSSTDGVKLTGTLAKFSQKNSKSLGALNDYRLGGEESVNAQAYLMPDGTVIAMEKNGNPPPELLNAPKETLDRLYDVMLFRAVE